MVSDSSSALSSFFKYTHTQNQLIQINQSMNELIDWYDIYDFNVDIKMNEKKKWKKIFDFKSIDQNLNQKKKFECLEWRFDTSTIIDNKPTNQPTNQQQ